MSLLLNAMPELLGGLGTAAVISGTVQLVRLLRRARAAGRPPHPPHNTQADDVDDTGSPLDTRVVLVKARRYTLLGAMTDAGHPLQITTTRLAGTVITQNVGGQERRFELTTALLYDGTFAAEPSDR